MKRAPGKRRGGRGLKMRVTDFDRGRVAAWAEGGIQQRTMAKRIGCALDTLRKHFADELESGSQLASADVVWFMAGVITGKIKAPIKVRATLAMFWAKTRMGWKDRQALELSGANGESIKVTLNLADHDRHDRG